MVRFAMAACEIRECDAGGQARILTVLQRYADLSMDYVDATLLVLAELEKTGSIATLDVSNFSVYRRTNGKALTLVF